MLSSVRVGEGSCEFASAETAESPPETRFVTTA